MGEIGDVMAVDHRDLKDQYVLRRALGFKMSRASRLMQQRLEKDLATVGMSRLTWCVLCSVGIEGITTPSGVADNLGINRPMLSRLLKSMSEDGLIHREQTADDGRNRRLNLTERGVAKLDACLPFVTENAAHFAQKFSADQLALLHQALDVISDGEAGHLDRL